MLSEADVVRLRHMLDASQEAIAFASNRSRQGLDEDRMLSFALVRAIEIIGEAARRVSEETVAAHPEPPWREMISMRNHIIHEYDEVDLEIVWDTVQKDVPRLISLVKPLVPSDDGS